MRLQVSEAYPEWAEVAGCPAHCLLCSEHATGAGPLAADRSAAETAAADRFRPKSHCQSKSSLCCFM